MRGKKTRIPLRYFQSDPAASRHELGTRDDVTMGVRKTNGNYFKGRITQMQVYNIAFTQEQVTAIKEKNNSAAENVSFSLKWQKG